MFYKNPIKRRLVIALRLVLIIKEKLILQGLCTAAIQCQGRAENITRTAQKGPGPSPSPPWLTTGLSPAHPAVPGPSALTGMAMCLFKS